MSDIGKRAAMNDSWRMCQRLNEVRLDCVLQKNGNRTGHSKLVNRNRLSVKSISDDDASNALFKIGNVFCKTDDGHQFGCHRNVETVFSRNP